MCGVMCFMNSSFILELTPLLKCLIPLAEGAGVSEVLRRQTLV